MACLGAFTLLAIALVHLDNWRTQLAALLIYSAAISQSLFRRLFATQSISGFRGQSTADCELISTEITVGSAVIPVLQGFR